MADINTTETTAEYSPQLIRLLRLQNGLNQTELAAKAGVSPSTICLIERGQRAITPKTARRIASAMAVEIGALIAIGTVR